MRLLLALSLVVGALAYVTLPTGAGNVSPAAGRQASGRLDFPLQTFGCT